MKISDDSFRLAIKNIAEFGDTDVFPFPLEKKWFAEEPEVVFKQLNKIRSDFESAFEWLPITSSTELVNVGHFGFRSCTQIESIWNAYFLASAIEVAEVVESKRQPFERVFSYRFSPDLEKGGLFSNWGWRDFHKRGLELAKQFQYVGLVDISDFYPRIYHHRLTNALQTDCQCDGNLVKTIDTLLRRLNSGNSYGLPVGGPASRILAEAMLTRSDRLLEIRNIEFLRFVDDYIIFGNSEDQIRTSILDLSRILLDNEGLSLNRNKIRIYSSDWYIQQSVFAESRSGMCEELKKKREYFSEFVRFDPYSETAEEDYQSLKLAVKKYDVLGMLFDELGRTPIDIYAVRQLVKSINFMDPDLKSRGVKKISSCLKDLSAVFTTVVKMFLKVRNDIEKDVEDRFYCEVRSLVKSRHPLIGASGTLAFAIQVLAVDPDPAAEARLHQIFEFPDRAAIVEREVIMAMGRRGANSWISDLRKRYNEMNSWSKRALLAASFSLGDEGREWRKRIRKSLPEHEKVLLDWISKKNSVTRWNLSI